MNEARRKAIRTALDSLAEVRATVENLRDEEQDCFDNMPESFQGGDKGSAAETAISALDSAITNIEDAESSLEESVE